MSAIMFALSIISLLIGFVMTNKLSMGTNFILIVEKHEETRKREKFLSTDFRVGTPEDKK